MVQADVYECWGMFADVNTTMFMMFMFMFMFVYIDVYVMLEDGLIRSTAYELTNIILVLRSPRMLIAKQVPILVMACLCYFSSYGQETGIEDWHC